MVRAVQACDFVAWEVRKGMETLRSEKRRARQSIGRLWDRMDPLARTWKTAGPEALVAMCERYAKHIPKR
jgi:hypothetical protein